MPVTMFTTTLVSHQNCQRWILGTKPSHHREGRCWHSVSATGHAALGWPTESGSLYWARYQARSARGNGCSRCHSSQAESHQGETMRKANFGATLLCLLVFMTVWNAFILAGDAECLLCAGQDTQARWVQFCLWGFFYMKKYKTESQKKEAAYEKTQSMLTASSLSRKELSRDYSFFYTLEILKRMKQQAVRNDGNFKKKSPIQPKVAT